MKEWDDWIWINMTMWNPAKSLISFLLSGAFIIVMREWFAYLLTHLLFCIKHCDMIFYEYFTFIFLANHTMTDYSKINLSTNFRISLICLPAFTASFILVVLRIDPQINFLFNHREPTTTKHQLLGHLPSLSQTLPSKTNKICWALLKK